MKNQNTTESTAAVSVGSDALVSRLIKSASHEAAFGNAHANLLFEAANTIMEYDDALRLAVKALEEEFGPLASEWPIIRKPLRANTPDELTPANSTQRKQEHGHETH